MVKLHLLAACLLVVWSSSTSVSSQCIPGMAVFNRTNHLVLNIGECNMHIGNKELSDSPKVTFARSKMNETYLLMLLESLPNSENAFLLHWLVSDIKLNGMSLMSTSGTHDLTSGYFPPVNTTQYEFRLYNMTGKNLWETVTSQERLHFLPDQWLNKNRVYATVPLAKTIFTVRSPIPGPPGWTVSPNPVGQYPGQQPPVYPAQQPPQYPVQHPSPPVHSGQQPPQLTGQPSPVHSGQQPPQLTGQPSPVYPVQQPQYPVQQPPPYPSNQQPQPPIPHPPVYPVQPPSTHFQPPQSSFHVVPRTWHINQTWYTIPSPGQPTYSPLMINSTLYTAPHIIKKFHLTPYLIIDNKSYIWRNKTHVPGKGDPLYINGTYYVPYNPPTKEIHHHYYNKKNSASSLTPSLLFAILLIPSLTWISCP